MFYIVKYNLNKLIKKNIIERVGSIKVGCWKLKSNTIK